MSQIESYYVLGYCRLKLGKTGDALEAATAARNCIEELGFLNNKPSQYFYINFYINYLLIKDIVKTLCQIFAVNCENDTVTPYHQTILNSVI